MSQALKTTVLPSTPADRPSATVIFLHGLGGTGANYESLIRPLSPMLPHVKFILPQAPMRHMTIFNSQVPSWYDIKGFSVDHLEDEEGIKESATKIHDIIEGEIKKGLPSNRIIVAGGSQGGAVALYAGLTYDKPLAGIVAVSTYLPLHKNFPEALAEANKATPVLMCHGDADTVVRPEWGKMSYDILNKVHSNIKFKSYPGVGHQISFDIIGDVVSFVAKHAKATSQQS